MELVPESGRLSDYLEETDEIDYSHFRVGGKARELFLEAGTELEFVKKAYDYVRDDIAHSWDIQSARITRKASEVSVFGEGICYAKSNLLAALLRSQGVPAGFCYQRLTIGDTPESGYCIHALNAVYLSGRGWIRLDARGNKEGIQAEFSVGEEKLAFPVREAFDETDYPTIYARPHASTMQALKENTNCLEMYRNGLPERI